MAAGALRDTFWNTQGDLEVTNDNRIQTSSLESYERYYN